jgi:hypothetical protein
MDPLSISASIVAVLQLTATISGYLYTVTNATTEQKRFLVEAINLSGMLTTLRNRVEASQSDEPWFQQVKKLGIKDGPLDQFKALLQIVAEPLLPSSSSKKRDRILSTLQWEWKKNEANDILVRMERLKSLIMYALTDDLFTLSQVIHHQLATLKKKTIQSDVSVQKVRAYVDKDRLSGWLKTPNPSTNFQVALEKRHQETGLWLITGQQYNEWKTSSHAFMWIHGKAGCGKTILSSILLYDILEYKDHQPHISVGYFYFDFNDSEKQSSKKALRSLLLQLALQSSDCLQALETLYKMCGNGTQEPAEDKIRELFKDAIIRQEYTYVVLDAMDECTDREPLLDYLEDLVTANLPGFHLVVTSRREKDIEDSFHSICNYSMSIDSAIVNEDIYRYIQHRLATDRKLQKWPAAVKEEITTAMMKRADGMSVYFE